MLSPTRPEIKCCHEYNIKLELEMKIQTLNNHGKKDIFRLDVV